MRRFLQLGRALLIGGRGGGCGGGGDRLSLLSRSRSILTPSPQSRSQTPSLIFGSNVGLRSFSSSGSGCSPASVIPMEDLVEAFQRRDRPDSVPKIQPPKSSETSSTILGRALNEPLDDFEIHSASPTSSKSTSSVSSSDPPTRISILPNGIRVISQDSSSPAVAVGVFVSVGHRPDSLAHSPGLTALWERMIFTSTARYPQHAIQDLAVDRGIHLAAATTRDCIVLGMQAFREQLPTCVEILAECTQRHKFLESDFLEAKRVFSLDCAMASKNLEHVLQNLVHSVAFPDHPLGQSPQLSDPEIAALRREDLIAFHGTHYTPSQLVIAGAGVTHAELVDLVAQNFTTTTNPSTAIDNQNNHTNNTDINNNNNNNTISGGLGGVIRHLDNDSLPDVFQRPENRATRGEGDDSRGWADRLQRLFPGGPQSAHTRTNTTSGSAHKNGPTTTPTIITPYVTPKPPHPSTEEGTLNKSAPTNKLFSSTTPSRSGSSESFSTLSDIYRGGVGALLMPALEPPVPHTALFLGFPVPGWLHSDAFTVAVIERLLGGGSSFSAGGPGKGMYSRLYTSALNQHWWIESIRATLLLYGPGGVFGLAATALPEHSRSLISVVADQWVHLARAPIDDEEWDRAKNALKSQMLMHLESRMTLVEDLGRQVLLYDRRFTPEYVVRKIDSVTRADVRAVVRRMLASPMTMAVCVGGLPLRGSDGAEAEEIRRRAASSVAHVHQSGRVSSAVTDGVTAEEVLEGLPSAEAVIGYLRRAAGMSEK